VVRQKSRNWWLHLAVPVIGFAILVYVVINAQVAAQTLGFVWFGIGLVLLVFLLATGRKPEFRAEEGL
jgi:peptidoglycan/LPS O-acetylase OafA/YrhL